MSKTYHNYRSYFQTVVIKHTNQTNKCEGARKCSISRGKCPKIETTDTGRCQFHENIAAYMDSKTEHNVSFVQDYYSTSSLNFKSSSRWCAQMAHRYRFSLGWKSFTLQEVTITLQSTVDQMPAYFSKPSNYTINDVGAKQWKDASDCNVDCVGRQHKTTATCHC
jgi:hypothetical protein